MDPWPLVAGVVAGAAAFGGVLAATGRDAPARPAATVARAPEGLQVFARMGCGSCHRLAAAGARGGMGPDLDAALAGHDRRSLTAAVIDPYRGRRGDAYVGMPEDYGRRLTRRELDALVGFLLAARDRAP